ncbi:MAG TPA: hypothetical protein VNH16_21560 [Burkholderiales bacterium]|jgi:hypothetical protein|nr:hypothetical protein [Burkholderiales bacterium]
MRKKTVLVALMLLPGCHTVSFVHPNDQDVKQLESMQQARSTGALAQVSREEIACDSVHRTCARLQMEKGGACLALAEASDPAERARVRECAATAFAAARRLTPPDAPPNEKLEAGIGLASSLRLRREGAAPDGRRAVNAELAQTAEALRGLPGGAPYGALFASDVELNRVLTGETPPPQQCAALAKAAADLGGITGAPNDVAGRIESLRRNIGDAQRSPARRCS